MKTSKILVTGANGQMGKELRMLESSYPDFEFLFFSKYELPIENAELVIKSLQGIRPAYCINCAAYTAVDKAEIQLDLAMKINGEATGELATACRMFNARLVHISTDYVFDGTATLPYRESDSTHPVNFYGKSKLKGEELSQLNQPDSIIIRTSWVYSGFGSNFLKTMLHLMNQKESVRVVMDQVGSPTYGADVAKAILDIIRSSDRIDGRFIPGIYHYSSEGEVSWYEFAVAIQQMTQSKCRVLPIATSEYPTAAKRPAYSVLNKEKIKETFGTVVPYWKDSLRQCLINLNLGTTAEEV